MGNILFFSKYGESVVYSPGSLNFSFMLNDSSEVLKFMCSEL
jgi:hypothetical protein